MTEEEEVRNERIMQEIMIVLREIEDFDRVLQILMATVLSVILNHMPKDEGLMRYLHISKASFVALSETYEENEESKKNG